MLVLSRKLGEKIVMPDLGITVKVIGLGNGRVRIGIDAPREIPIQRVEVLTRTEEEKRQSLKGEHAIVG